MNLNIIGIDVLHFCFERVDIYLKIKAAVVNCFIFTNKISSSRHVVLSFETKQNIR